ncbi:GDSL-type esterase/lipase family protein [Streptomyces sp. SP18CS02]|uniref:GDSL-type esterase/lipase family protein n=1 Tax=Streptomyces sp. SP18CS02 TaxID=3002531 RepID=UPI002E772E37|nr:GDSL-type esterase/lipase family protein [Streptomyces sp. SP18CS02]MEE1754054.1 GDSL-type esterase/lipase family protein [Streptomyces sp. SP18CS02]
MVGGSTGRGRRTRRRVRRALVGGYAWLLVRGELWDGRKSPSAQGRYGSGEAPSVPVVLLGDSSAVTVGVVERGQTNGFRLAEGLVAELGCAVEVDVLARAGVTTAGMARQVEAALARPDRGVALILVGGNDVMLPLPVRRPAARLGRYVARLRGAGWQVVVGACADIGAAPALRRGVGPVASARSRRLARKQAAAALAHGASVVSLSTDAFRDRPRELYCPDGFHPNADGYLLYARRAAVAVTEAVRAHLTGAGPAHAGDVYFDRPAQAARHVTREHGACFLPLGPDGLVVMRRHTAVPDGAPVERDARAAALVRR